MFQLLLLLVVMTILFFNPIASESQRRPIFRFRITHGTNLTENNVNSSGGFVANLYRSPLILDNIRDESGRPVPENELRLTLQRRL